MISNSPFELWRMLEKEKNVPRAKRLEALAAMADAPPEDFSVSLSLPVRNPLPAYKLGDGSLGSQLDGQNYGIAAPVIGQNTSSGKSIGELLVGDS